MPTIAIIMSAHNEEETVERAVAALCDQRGMDDVTVDLHVFLDRCTDATEERLRRLMVALDTDVNVVPSTDNETGADGARRIAVNAVLASYGSALPDYVLFTDADSVVPENWIETSLFALSKVDVVAGFPVIEGLPEPVEALLAYEDRLRALGRMIYPMKGDTAPSHTRLHGSSLGFNAKAAACMRDTDHTLAEWMENAPLRGLLVQHSRAVTVRTSGRLVGRDENGLATRLASLVADNEDPLVTDPAQTREWATQCKFARHVHRLPHGDDGWAYLSRMVGKGVPMLRAVASRHELAEAFVADLIGPRPQGATLPLSQARKQVDALIRSVALGQ